MRRYVKHYDDSWSIYRTSHTNWDNIGPKSPKNKYSETRFNRPQILIPTSVYYHI